MSSTDPTPSHDSAEQEPPRPSPWTRLGALVVACAVAGVITAWALPTLLSSFEWPKLVSKQWIESLAHPPQPEREPPPNVGEAIAQPVASPALEKQPAEPASDETAEQTTQPPSNSPPKTSDEAPPEPEARRERRDAKPTQQPEEPRDVTYKVDRRAISKIIRSPADLSRHGRFVPNIVDGQRRGFKFVDVAAGGLFDRLGVHQGDVILEVNGRTLTTQTKLLEDLKVLKSAHVYVVRIQRGDTERIHRYDAGPPLKRKTGPAANAN